MYGSGRWRYLSCQDTYSFSSTNGFLFHAIVMLLIFHFSYLVDICILTRVYEKFFNNFIRKILFYL